MRRGLAGLYLAADPARVTGGAERLAVVERRSERHDGTSRGALVFHGSGATAAQAIPSWSVGCVVAELVHAGYLAVAPDGRNLAGWANDENLAAADAAYTFLTAAGANPYVGGLGARPGRVLVVGYSMGAAVALNWIRRNRELVAGAVLFAPAVDLQWQHDNQPAHAAAIDAAYAAQGGWAANRLDHNPLDFAAELAGLRHHAWVGSTDDVTPAARVAAYVAAVDDPWCGYTLLDGRDHTTLFGGELGAVVPFANAGEWS